MDLVNWQSRLAVKYKAGNGQEELISPIDSFQPSFGLGAEALHSVEKTHIGVVYSPQQITFSLTVTGTATIRARSLSVSPTRLRSAASVVASARPGPTPLTRAPAGS